ncbi:GvpL/GvpF family gas vesicle protein, partial [Saccharomonospora xinjiangensis]|uniref:GvpL/GvpF family gas vesicle protein n=1 Tax=Saccharomonospora xinjiangensis TaxID=75294 RepID=UPI003510680E
MSEHPTPTGLWLYAVARGLDPAPLEDLRGVAGAPVRDVRVRDEDTREELVAVVSPVSLDEFGEQALRRNLEDLDWLSATARAHDAVVAAVSAAATAAVPLRLATVSFDEDRVRDLVTRNRAEFVTTLNALSGRTEWGVKVYTDPGRLAAPAGSAASTPASGESSSGGAGAAYLRRRKAALSARETGERVAAEHAERLHTRLAGAAVADPRPPPQAPKRCR